MTSPHRGAVVAIVVLAFVCSVAGLAVSQSTTTHTAQVRINARQLDDGRVEFALQQRDGASWGDRLLLPGRFLAANVGHDRWVSTRAYTVSIEVPVAQVEEDLMEDEPATAQSTSAGPAWQLTDPTTLPLVALTAARSISTHSTDSGYHVIAARGHGSNDAGAPVTTTNHYACQPGSGSLLHWHNEHGWGEVHHPDRGISPLTLLTIQSLHERVWSEFSQALVTCGVTLASPAQAQQPVQVVPQVTHPYEIWGSASNPSWNRAQLLVRCPDNVRDWYLQVQVFDTIHHPLGDYLLPQEFSLALEDTFELVHSEVGGHQWHVDLHRVFASGLDAKYFWEQALAEGEFTMVLPAVHGGPNTVTIGLTPYPGEHRPCG
ncbi:MAG: hypothetical protein OXS30_03880 [Chloroflexota bacterium]|nr:hypothetical protein [Chloroflexota bacterium]